MHAERVPLAHAARNWLAMWTAAALQERCEMNNKFEIK